MSAVAEGIAARITPDPHPTVHSAHERRERFRAADLPYVATVTAAGPSANWVR
jgi:hypothetical protein